MLQASDAGINSLAVMDSKVRPLLVLGNTCQTEYIIFGRNEISVQVDSKDNDLIKKEHKAIAKLPKLMNLISASK